MRFPPIHPNCVPVFKLMVQSHFCFGILMCGFYILDLLIWIHGRQRPLRWGAFSISSSERDTHKQKKNIERNKNNIRHSFRFFSFCRKLSGALLRELFGL